MLHTAPGVQGASLRQCSSQLMTLTPAAATAESGLQLGLVTLLQLS